jgi:anti-anti-sigma factor
MKLSLVRIDKGGFVALAAEGTITTADVQGAAAKGVNVFEGVLGPGWATNQVLLDMGQVNFIDSSAIGWLIDSNKAFKKAGGRLVPHSIQPPVRQVLDLLRIGQAIPLASDEAAAKAMLENVSQG